MIVSVTEIETFLRCRRRWDLSSLNRKMLSPIINAPPLVVGGLVHAALAWWRENPQGDPVNYYQAISSMELASIIDTYTKNIGVAPTRDELEPNDIAITLGKVVIENYVKVWEKPLPDGYELVNNEQTLLVPIPGTEHCTKGTHGDYCMCEDCAHEYSPGCCSQVCKCCTTTHFLEATLDGLLVDPRGNYFILECKTYGRTPSETELADKFQFVAYMWALQQTGIKARAMLYDGLLKVDHVRRGHTLADNFLRKLLVRPQAEIDEFGRYLVDIANVMADPNVPLYKTVPVLGGCVDCSGYIKLCRAMSRGEHVDYSNYIRRDYKAEGDGWHRSEVWSAT